MNWWWVAGYLAVGLGVAAVAFAWLLDDLDEDTDPLFAAGVITVLWPVVLAFLAVCLILALPILGGQRLREAPARRRRARKQRKHDQRKLQREREKAYLEAKRIVDEFQPRS